MCSVTGGLWCVPVSIERLWQLTFCVCHQPPLTGIVHIQKITLQSVLPQTTLVSDYSSHYGHGPSSQDMYKHHINCRAREVNLGKMNPAQEKFLL